MPEFAVIGPGAIGTWLAGRLAEVGRVQLVGRDPRWLARARREGVRIWEAGKGRARRPPRARLAPVVRPDGPVDAVFLCVKSGDASAAALLARSCVGPRAPVVSLQNGLTHVRPVRLAVGSRRAVFASCLAAVGREGPVTVRHHAGDTIWIGRTAMNAAAASAARRWLRRAGLRVPAGREDRVLWTKAVFNAATNPVGALAAEPNGALADTPALWAIVERSLREAAAIARRAGHPPLAARMADLVRASARAAPRQENSMLQDLRAGRRTEADAILGPLLLEARRRRLAAPTLEALRRFVLRLERELRTRP